MLIYTNLISELEHSLQLIGRWNILPLKYPYQLNYRKDEGIYTITTNKSFIASHWRIEIFLLTLSSILGFIRLYQEDQSSFDRFTTTYFSGFSFFLVVTGIFQKNEAGNFSELLNQLGYFERRHGLYKMTTVSSKAVIMACKQLSDSMFRQSIFYSLSCALFPTVSWNVIPISISESFPVNSNDYQYAFVVAMEILRRVLIFLYLYVTNRVLTNFATNNVVIHLLISTYCLNAGLKVVKRPRKCFRTHKKIVGSIHAYREVELLCDAYNRIHRQSLIPLLIWSGIICFSASLFFLVSKFDQLDLLAVLIFSNAVLMGTTLLLFCFHFPAKLFASSKAVIRGLQREQQLLGGKDKALDGRSLRALRPVRIRFLHSNFFDKLTPLNLFIFATKVAIRFTLMEEK